MKKLPGVKILEEVKGIGTEIKKGDTVRLKLNGWLNKGDQIQKNYLNKVMVGSRNLIPGIEYAIEGMRKNGMRKVQISPHLGYRDKGVEGIIPPNAVLIYQIEVIDVESIT
ncbi:MAG: FKBP-type peptidyl-prolyl cis-trans isomerase [Candidatus Thiodiazotropha taylori]|nr:FKBP-type peptidyl-prolyl cis-trans isomerase [Candidatus Thiodiazotropha taylori]MCW4319967.1 FKBP-type peptidyl-prolyl cis-trans isomerase [Candidatus Thiodiazotropha taylori]